MKEVLCDSLTVDTCLECLVGGHRKMLFWHFSTYLKVLADLHSAAELKEAAVKFVVEHSEEFVDQVSIAPPKKAFTPSI